MTIKWFTESRHRGKTPVDTSSALLSQNQVTFTGTHLVIMGGEWINLEKQEIIVTENLAACLFGKTTDQTVSIFLSPECLLSSYFHFPLLIFFVVCMSFFLFVPKWESGSTTKSRGATIFKNRQYYITNDKQDVTYFLSRLGTSARDLTWIRTLTIDVYPNSSVWKFELLCRSRNSCKKNCDEASQSEMAVQEIKET